MSSSAFSPQPAPQGATAESAVCVSELSYFIFLSPEVLLFVHVQVLGRPRVSERPCPRELLGVCPGEWSQVPWSGVSPGSGVKSNGVG